MTTPIPAVLQAYMQGLRDHNVDAIAATVADTLAFVTPARTLAKDEFLGMLGALYGGFPDWHYEHDPPEVRGETIAVKWRQAGTHTRPFVLPGIEPIPATGRRVEIPEQHFFYTVRSGQIVEIRPDPLPGGAPGGILEQIGANWAPAKKQNHE